MAKKKQDKFEKQDEQLQEVNEALTGAGKWIEEHANALSWCITIIALVAVAIMAYNQFVVTPKKQAANEAIAKTVGYFMVGDYEKALYGDDIQADGFEAIADQYSNQEGKLAALYAGICHFERAEYEEAVEFLKRFSADDVNFDPAAHQLLGDAYVELQQYDEAAKAFEAAAKSGNKVIAPMSLKKAGIVYLHEGENAKALKAFKTIKEKYPNSNEAKDIDKYIAIAQ